MKKLKIHMFYIIVIAVLSAIYAKKMDIKNDESVASKNLVNIIYKGDLDFSVKLMPYLDQDVQTAKNCIVAKAADMVRSAEKMPTLFDSESVEFLKACQRQLLDYYPSEQIRGKILLPE